MKPFLLKVNDSDINNDVDDNNFAVQILKKARKNSNDLYTNLKFIPPTSNVVERFFSVTKYVYSDHRQSMTIEHLENILFLKMHIDLWKPSDIQIIINNNKAKNTNKVVVLSDAVVEVVDQN